MHEIALRFAHIQERLRAAALRADRRLEDVQVLAATKWRSANQINAAIQAGVRCIGENRVQEAKEKIKILGRPVPWHLIGPLQTNKVKDALVLFDLIHSVDRPSLVQELDKRARATGKRAPRLDPTPLLQQRFESHLQALGSS